MDVLQRPDLEQVRSADSTTPDSTASIEPELKDYTKEAHSFLDQHGGQFHEALNCAQTDLDAPQTTFSRQTTLTDSSRQHAEIFQKALQIYQEQSNDKDRKIFDLVGKTTWKDVLIAADEAETAYRDVGGKPLRKVGRWITDKSEAAVPFLRCLPNDPFYTNIISGGLMIVFQAASRISKNRDNVMETLLRIPDAIEQAERCVAVFPNDQRLVERTLKVFLTALAAIEGTIKWMRGSPAGKVFKALFTGTLYSKTLLENKQALEVALGGLDEYLTTLHVEQLAETGAEVKNISMVVERVEEKGIIIDKTTKTTLHQIQSIQGTVQASEARIDGRFTTIDDNLRTVSRLQSDTHTKIDGLKDIEEAKRMAREAMALVLAEAAKNSEWQLKQGKYIRRLKREVRILSAAANATTPEDVINLLGGSEHRITDLRLTLRACEVADLFAYDIAMGIVQHSMLQDWLHIGESVALFIEGGLSLATAYERNASPLSHTASILIKALDQDPAVPIWFFCGPHSSPNDPLRGPQGLMRSLISQVLSIFPIHLDFVSTTRYRQQLASHNLHTLCDFFGKLIKRIEPPSVIICVIDSISTLEKPEWSETCRFILFELQELLEDEEVSIVFKLLVTSPDRSRYAAATFPKDCHLQLADQIPNTRNGPTERQAHRFAQRPPPNVNRKKAIQALRRKSDAGAWTDESGDEVENDQKSDSDDWDSDDGNGNTRVQHPRQRAAVGETPDEDAW